MAKKKRAYGVEEEEGADASFHRLLECFAPKARLGRIGDRSGSSTALSRGRVPNDFLTELVPLQPLFSF